MDTAFEIPIFLRREKGSVPSAPFEIIERPKTLSFNNAKSEVIKREGPNVQMHIRGKAGSLIADLEGMIDDGLMTHEWSFYDHARKADWSAVVVKHIADHFRSQIEELSEVIDTNDPDLKYAYRGYTKREIQDMLDLRSNLVEDADRFTSNNKKTIVRRKKAVSSDRLLKRFKYAKSYEPLKLVSINPVDIIKAQALWIFHPGSNVITVYRAIDRGGLSIDGVRIKNYDEKSSRAKKLGHHAEDRVNSVLNGGKVFLRKFLDSFRGSEAELTRITKNHILLKVEK